MSRETNTCQTRGDKVAIKGLLILRLVYRFCSTKMPGVLLTPSPLPLNEMFVHRGLSAAFLVKFP